MKASFNYLIVIAAILVFALQNSFAQYIVVTQDLSVAGDIILENPVALPIATRVTFDSASAGWSGAYFSAFSYGGDNGLHLLHDPSVMKDLELVDQQRIKIADVRKEFSQKLQEASKEYRAAKHVALKQDIQTRMKSLRKEQTEALSEVLLPHQRERIQQVSRQMQLKSMGTAQALQYGVLGKELEITDGQKKKLKEIQAQMQKELAAKTAEIKEAAKERALAELTTAQKSKLKEFTGEKFNRDPQDWQEHRNRQKAGKSQPKESRRN